MALVLTRPSLEHRAYLLRAVLATIALCSFPLSSTAQITDVTNNQATPYHGMGHDYISGLNETVDPANGSLSLRIAVPLPPARGLTFPFSFEYNSNGVIQVEAGGSYPGVVANADVNFAEEGGWRYSLPIISADHGTTTNPHKPTFPNTCGFTYDYMFEAAEGGRHALGLGIYDNQYQCDAAQVGAEGGPYTTGGDNDYSATVTLPSDTNTDINYYGIPITIVDDDGDSYYFTGFSNGGDAPCITYCSLPDYIEDRNGNKTTFVLPPYTTGSAYPLSIVDSVGRPAVTIAGFGSTSGDHVSISGQSQPYVVTWGSTPYNIVTQFTYPSYNPTTCASVGSSTSGTMAVITQITLPNGQAYTFGYDPVSGLLDKITYPTGAYVSYVWGLSPTPTDSIYYSDIAFVGNEGTPTPVQGQPDACSGTYKTFVILQRTMFDGKHASQTQTFSYATTFPGTTSWTTKQTIVSTQDLLTPSQPKYTTTYLYTPFTITPQPLLFAVAYDGPSTLIPLESNISSTDANGVLLQAIAKTWDNSTPNRLATVATTISGATAQITFQYDRDHLNFTEKDESDFGAPGSGNPGALLRKTLVDYANLQKPCRIRIQDAKGDTFSERDMEYDGGTTLCGTENSSPTQAVSGLPPNTHDESAYGPSALIPRGNLTRLTNIIVNGISPVTQYTYDETGQLLTVADSGGNVTRYSYSDSPTGANASGNSNAYLTQTVSPVSNGVSMQQKYAYNYSTGELANEVDANNQTTVYTYNDPLNRLTQTAYPDGGTTTLSYDDSIPNVTSSALMAEPNQLDTSVTTLDGFGRVISTALMTDPQGADTTTTTYDGMGNVSSLSNAQRSFASPTDGTTTYSYDGLGRKTLQTQPDGSTKQWCYNGQPTSSVPKCPANLSSLSSGSWINVFDENGNHSQQITDGLGRVTAVVEPNAQSGADIAESDYAYDVLDNLTRVDQWGGPAGSANDRVRQFTYDGLSRLLSSANPESGAIVYLYTNAGALCSGDPSEVCSRTDARGVTTTYSYDSLNRVIGKSYSNDPSNTSPVSYKYDTPAPGWTFPNQTTPAWSGVQQTNLIGRLSSEANANQTIVYGYDPMGRTVLKSACTPSTCGVGDDFDMHYQYDLAGNVKFSDLGLDAVRNAATPNAGYYYGGITLAYNGASQLITGTADTEDTTHPASIVSGLLYSPLGGVTSMQLGNVYGEGDQYTPRGWLQQRYGIDVANGLQHSGTLSHDNVGNVIQLVDSTNGTTFYTYDHLNRLTSFTNPYAGVTYGFDAWGNMTTHTQTVGTGYSFSLNYNANNQTAQAGSTNGGLSYDASGDVLFDGLNNYGYDGEGRLLSVDGSTTYLYGPDGTRAATAQGGSVVAEYLYDPSNTLVTTLGTDGKMVRGSLYGGGMHLADYTAGTGAGGGQTEFRFMDEVNSLAIKLDQAGNILESCYQNPFGESLNCNGPTGTSSATDFTETHFTDKKRDAESGLDYFGARYYGSITGRFMSPDPLGGHLENPQSLNKYAYALNNPLTNTDPTGLDSYLQCTAAADGSNASTCQSQRVGGTDQNPQMATVQGVTGANGFTATRIGNNPDGSGGLMDLTTGTGSYTASVNGSGVQFSNDGGQTSASGVYVNGTPNNTFQDAGFANGGALSGFTFTLTNSKMEANQTEAGTFTFAGTPEQAGQALLKAGFYSPLLGENVGQNEYRSPGSFWTGSNSTHVNVDQINLAPRGSVPSAGGDFHTGEHNLKNPIAAGYHCFSDHASACSW